MHEGVECGAFIFCLCITHCTDFDRDFHRGDSADFFELNMTRSPRRCVDLYPGYLSVARSRHAATSLPNLGLAFFAGGYVGTC